MDFEQTQLHISNYLYFIENVTSTRNIFCRLELDPIIFLDYTCIGILKCREKERVVHNFFDEYSLPSFPTQYM